MDKYVHRKEEENQKKIVQMNDNEIMEILYIKKIDDLKLKDIFGAKKKSSKASTREHKKYSARQFLVRKKRSLELMYTNGLNCYSMKIPNSDVQPPFNVSDITLSNNGKIILAYYSVSGNDQYLLKTFKQDPIDEYQFQQYQHSFNTERKLSRNIVFDKNDNIMEIKINLLSSQKKKLNQYSNFFVERDEELLQISIDKQIFWKSLFDPDNFLDRVMISGDGRLLLCGKVIIQLTATLDDIENIGVMSIKRDNQQVHY